MRSHSIIDKPSLGDRQAQGITEVSQLDHIQG